MSETLTDNDYRTLLVYAIYGCGFPSVEYAIDMESKCLARFCGDQHNEKWEWDKESLRKLSFEELHKIYNNIK